MTRLLDRYLAGERIVILDGGLATELEARGADLSDPLWSARLLLDDDGAARIEEVHRAYLDAGADCIITASYQASHQELVARVGESGANDALRRAVEIARRAVAATGATREFPALVAASVGPYGAAMANGAEYTGLYDIDDGDLDAFHRPRIEILARCRPDLFAFETMPKIAEAKAVVRLAEEIGVRGWVSFCCRDGETTAFGEPFAEAVRAVAASPAVLAVGVNCTAPRYVEPLLRIAADWTKKPLVAYPNSGESWSRDAGWRSRNGTETSGEFERLARAWRSAGARFIGGCCRVGPAEIRRLAAALRSHPDPRNDAAPGEA